MSLRIIAGRSGQGKTARIMEEAIAWAGEHPERNCYIIVPEQFSLEMQRKLVESHPDHGYFNIDVLSFYRLAYRVFDECNFQPKDILEDLGVALILRKILSEHEEEFPFFKKSIRKTGFIDELKSMLMEFICYGVTWEQMQGLEEKLKEHPGLETKCRELGKIFEYFDKDISQSFMVAEQILDALSEIASQSEMLRDGVFYFDGFAGFTPVQFKFLKELLKTAEQVNVSVTIEGDPFKRTLGGGTAAKKEEEELFYFSEKVVRSLAEICREAKVEIDDPMVIADGETPRFYNKEMAFLEKYLFRSSKKTYEHEMEHIHLTVCRNPAMEADYILHKIERMVRTEGYRYRDFAVLTGKVEDYASAFRRQADILNIPLFEDTKRRVSYHSGVETIRALFHLAAMDYSYESVFRYLKSGMSDMTDEETDFLENYVIWSGIRGYSMWKKPFVRRMDQIEKEKGEYLQLLREKVLSETADFTDVLKDRKKTVKEKMTALYEAMCRLQYNKKLKKMADMAEQAGEYVREKEYRQLFRLILALLDKIVGIFGEEYLPAEELEDIIDAGLESLELGAPPLSMDQLILGDLKRTRLTDIQVLFIAGMNEGNIPVSLEDRGIIHDDEKKVLEECGVSLSLRLAEQSMEDDFYVYLAFSKPRRQLFFTYALQDGGGFALNPSPLLKECRRLFPALKERFYPGEEIRYYFNPEDGKEMLVGGLELLRKGEEGSPAFRTLLKYWWETDELKQQVLTWWNQRNARTGQKNLPEELMRELFGRELRGSITRLEKFAACPYQYYCVYGLELREREEYQVRAADLGNLFHHALEIFSKRLKESKYRWKNIPEEIAGEWIREAVEKASEDGVKDILYSSARNQYKLRVVNRILKRTVRVLQMHLQNSQMEPDRFELHFGKTDHLEAAYIPLKNGNRMRLEGVIDRVDICEEEDRILLRIIDYKSGIKTFDMNDVYHGLQMQLVIYMDAASEIYQKETGKNSVPAGMFYYSLKDPILKGDEGEEESLKKNFRMSGYANSDETVLEKMEEGQENFLSASVRMTKKGTPYKNSAVMSTEDFQYVGRYMRRKMKEMGEAVYDGEIAASPYKNEKGCACDYCPYLSVCGFNPKLEEYAFRDLKKQSAQDVLEAMKKEASGGSFEKKQEEKGGEIQ